MCAHEKWFEYDNKDLTWLLADKIQLILDRIGRQFFIFFIYDAYPF